MVQIKINGIDRTNYISWQSLTIENILTKQVDTCSFTIENYEGKIYKPQVEDEVQVFKDDTKIFAGNIKRISEKAKGRILIYQIECADYTRLLDKMKAAVVYENKTVNEIIADLRDRYFTDFTINGIDCEIEIPYIVFNYEIISQCFDRLSELTGYDWYVDYDKDIHFFLKGSNPAPFNLDDENGKYVFNSLNLQRDTSQIRNVVFVRGAEYLGELYTEKIVSTGTPTTYPLAYKYSGLTVKVGGTPYTVGIDYIDKEEDFDCLHNFQEKVIKFKETTKPSDGKVIEISGYPYVPVMVYRKDNDSVNTYGEYQYYQYDREIQDRVSAEKLGDSLLTAYKDPVINGSFQTYETGLRAGQDIIIQSDIRGLNETVLINRVRTKMITPTDLVYNIDFNSAKDSGIIEVLASLVLKRERLEYNKDEIVYKTFSFNDEQMSLADETAVFKNKYVLPFYVKNGNTPIAIVGFCQCS